MHKNLPHMNTKEHYQFITFRTQDSIDKYVLQIQENSNINNKIKQYKIDEYLDKSTNGAYLFDENIKILKDIILHKDNIMYEIEIFSIMPNHVHLLLKQKDDLNKIVKYIKGKSAIELNKNLNKTGKFWLNSYFDKGIRDQKHFEVVYDYILNNPLKANLEDMNQRVYSKY